MFQIKIDTGADVSVLPKSLIDQLNSNDELQIIPTNAALISYGNFKIKPLGIVNLECRCNKTRKIISFMVIDCKKSQPLLGLDDCIKFGIISKIDSVQMNNTLTKNDIFDQFQNLKV